MSFRFFTESCDASHYEERVVPKSLSDIKTFTKKHRHDSWLNVPYFENVRTFLKEERYKVHDTGFSYYFGNCYSAFTEEQAAKMREQGWAGCSRIKIVINKKQIYAVRIEGGGRSTGVPLDEKPQMIVSNYEDFPTFKEAYNKIFEYIDLTWKYQIRGFAESTPTSEFYNLEEKCPGGVSLNLLPEAV